MTEALHGAAATPRPAPRSVWPVLGRPRRLRRGDLAHWMSPLLPASSVRAAEPPPVDLYAEACAPEGALVVDGVPFGYHGLAPPR